MHIFAFLNLEHPPVAWAVMRWMMVSADHASPSANQGFISFMQAGMIEHQNNARIFNESIIEGIRNTSFANRVSRMRGLYCFPSRAEAEARIDDRGWPLFFSAQNLLELELHCDTRPTIVDANWITFAPLGADGRINTNDLSWITRYWAGEPFNDCTVWELLANGVALILDTDVRRRCFELVKRVFHESHIPILMSRLASEAGTRGGLITPFLLSENDQHVRLGYLWSDAEFRDPTVIEKIAGHPDCGFLHRLRAMADFG